MSPVGLTKEVIQQWEFFIQGVIKIAPIKLAPRISTLESKTVVLRWNGKDNGGIT
jgi:hypothetical protein